MGGIPVSGSRLMCLRNERDIGGIVSLFYRRRGGKHGLEIFRVVRFETHGRKNVWQCEHSTIMMHLLFLTCSRRGAGNHVFGRFVGDSGRRHQAASTHAYHHHLCTIRASPQRSAKNGVYDPLIPFRRNLHEERTFRLPFKGPRLVYYTWLK